MSRKKIEPGQYWALVSVLTAHRRKEYDEILTVCSSCREFIRLRKPFYLTDKYNASR